MCSIEEEKQETRFKKKKEVEVQEQSYRTVKI